MRRSGICIVILCMFALWLVLTLYLAALPPEPRGIPHINIGIVQVTEARASSSSFEDANRLVADIRLDLPDESTEKDIYYIQGRDMDDTGNATSWMFGVVSQNRTSLLMYDRTGLTVTPWNKSFPGSVIEPDRLFPLERLFREQYSLFPNGAGMERRVELVNMTYYVTVSDSTMTKTFAFDATNGALVQSNEG